MQQGEAGGLAILDLGDQHNRAPIGAAPSSPNLPLGRHQVLAAPQGGVAVGAGGQPHGDAAPVDHMDRGGGGVGMAVDAVADVAGDRGHRGVEGGERAQRAVAELVAGGPSIEGGPNQGQLQQRLLGSGDAHGHGLGLVADGVHRAGELADGHGEHGGEVFQHHRRGAHPPPLQLVGVERGDAQGVAVHGGHLCGGASLETAVVAALAEVLEELLGGGGELRAEVGQ